MNCKHCQAALEDGVTVCPACGEINELPEKGSVPTVNNSPMKIALSVVAIVLVVAILGAIVITGMKGFGENDTAEPADPNATVAATAPADGNPDDVTCKGSYTVSDEEAIAAANTVVATIGDATLTNADLQIYYWMQVLPFLNDYSSYLAMLGLDYTQPLDTQMSMVNEEWTWQQYFLSKALDAWQTYDALAMQAVEAGFDSDEDYQTYVANIRSDIAASIAQRGYASVDEFLNSLVGPGSTEDAYYDYLTTYYLSYLYNYELYYAIDPTDEEVEAYFDENVDVYTEQEITKDDESILVDVRHTLIMPKGGTTDESGVTTYSDEEWEACRAQAQALLDEWLAGDATEDTFAEMANTHSQDGGSNTAGGLYTYIAVGDMVQEFEDWCFDETRVTGDYGLVKTTYGYHIMYYVTSRPVWYAYAESDLIKTLSNEIVPNAVAAYDVNIDYSAIVLGEVNLTGEEEPEEVVEEPEKDNDVLVIVLAIAVIILASVLLVVVLKKSKQTVPTAEPEVQSPEAPAAQPTEDPETTEE
ncbi:MAG: peptidylprolyl isomerase [Oscillospiraceae bacterium]|nr:peptidylprolyl isomerase [Oscillospiraceae bacterium]